MKTLLVVIVLGVVALVHGTKSDDGSGVWNETATSAKGNISVISKEGDILAFIKNDSQYSSSTVLKYLEDSSAMKSNESLTLGHAHPNETHNNFSRAEAVADGVYTYGSALDDSHPMDTKWIVKELPGGGIKILLRNAERDDEERRITDISFTSWNIIDLPATGSSSVSSSRTQDIKNERVEDGFKDSKVPQLLNPLHTSNIVSEQQLFQNSRQDGSQPEASKDWGSYIGEQYGGLQFEPHWLLDHLEEIIAENNLCRNHTALFLNELRNLTRWAVSMLDATSKLPEGILQGNIRDLGSFDECLGVRATVADDSAEVFRGQYCLANLQFEADAISTHHGVLEGLLDVMTAGRRSLEITRNRKGNFLPYFALFEWALCVPSTCKAQDVQTALRTISDNLQLNLRVNISVDPENCQVDGPIRLEPRDFGMLTALLLIVLLVAAGTLYDLKLKLYGPMDEKIKADNLILAFSLYRNTKKLLDTSSTPGTFKSVEGIRFLTILWVIATHKVFSMSREPWTNKTFLLQMAEPVWKMPLQNSMLNVDTFFVVGGMLRAYNSLREMEQGRCRCFCDFLQRYLRLTPAYAVVIGVWATLLVHLSSGPTWYRNIVLNSEHCQDNWPLNILYVNNYIDGHDMCMPHTWYLAADMQMFLLAPLIVYPMWRFGWLGRLFLVLALGASVAVLFVIIFLYKFLGIQSAGFHDTMLQDYTIYVYLPTHMRFSSYLVGLALGYTFHRLDARPEFSLSKVKVILGWSMSLLTLAAVMFGPYSLMMPGTPYRPLDQGLYGSLHRFAWALGVAWIIFACHKGYGGPVNLLLSLPLLRPLARLTYSIYLVHMAVILVGTARLRTALYMDDFYVVHSLVADVVISTALAAVLYLTVELPCVTLTSKMLPRRRAKM